MEFVLPLINNVGLLALAAVVYSATPQLQDAATSPVRSAVLGLGLGLTAAVVMLSPIQFAPGFIYDTRNAPLLLAGVLGGPISALISVVPPVVIRASIGGVGMVPGISEMVIVTLCSVAAWGVMRRRTFRNFLPVLLVYSAASSTIALLSLMLIPDKEFAWSLLIRFGPVIVLTNVAGVGILGLMIGHEIKRLALIDDLRRTETAAREALMVRNRFIAMMSHEVRTPLNAILGYAQLLRDDRLSASQKERVDRLSASAKNLLRLIDDILHFSQYQDRQEDINVERRPLRAIVETALSNVRGEALRKGLDLRLAHDGVPDAIVEVDADRLRRCLTNTLSNAVKFTQQGHVLIAVSIAPLEQNGGKSHNALLTITVSDTGIGIDQDRQEMIFEPFERLTASAFGGAGLGMATVRAAVKAMGGSVTIESTPEVGTTVTLEIPTATHGPAPSDTVGSHINVTYTPTRDGIRVLVVDDIEINADIACAFLNQIGCRTAVATNGSEAVQTVRDGEVDAVLMDIEMPVMDGLEATRKIRDPSTDEPARSIPIVALTAHASRDDMVACLEAGMNGYLSKPIDKSSLFDALARVDVLKVAAVSGDVGKTSIGTVAPEDSKPPFSAERYAALAKLVPAETLKIVLEQAASEIEALGAQIVTTDVASEDKRQALHKMISITGNIGLLRLSALSLRLQEIVRSGAILSEQDIALLSQVVSEAIDKIAELQSAPTAAN